MRFQVGEMAIYAVPCSAETMRIVGEQVEIMAVGIRAGQFYFGRPAGQDGDYIIRFSNGDGNLCMDFQLRKINPPDEPNDMRRDEEIEEEIEA
jgi:hypothetical protein